MTAEQEACRLVILHRDGVSDVAAPMQEKELCYDILNDAALVIARTENHLFSATERRIIIMMNMSGRVDVGAPLPPRELCSIMLEQARDVIERYDDDAAPPMIPFSSEMLGEARH